MMRLRTFFALASVACACSSSITEDPRPEPPCEGASFDGSPVSLRCGALMDADGRELIFTGVNVRALGVFDVSFDDGRAPLEEIPPFGPEDARRMRALGFGALRLPIQWSGVEPSETGGFDEGYLGRVASAVDAARSAGMLVLIDLHQDAYSKEIGEDGAPYWAIIPPPPAKLGGPLTDLEQRRLSKPVLDAFATFFGPSPDGVRLRERFAKMAAHVAHRFADDSAVIGLELFNEPLATTEQLTSFHAQVLAAVRAVAPRKLVVFEPPATRNLTDRADIVSEPLGPGTVYAPHIYTAAFSGDEVRAAVTREAVERSYLNARAEAEGWQAPIMVTEYGFPPSDAKLAEYLGWHAELADAARASTFLWLWKESSQGSWGLFDRDASGAWIERPAVVQALARVRLEAAAGRIVDIRRPNGAASLVVDIEGTPGTRENLISLGTRYVLDRATCDGNITPTINGEPLRATCGGPGRHVLEIHARPAP